MSRCGKSASPDLWEPRGAVPGATRPLGYVESVDAGLLDALDKVRATLVKVLQ